MALLGTGLVCPTAFAATSGGYRGPQNNGIYLATGLLKKWPDGGPKLLWKYPIEQGYAGVTVVDGTVYIASDVESHLYVLTLDGELKHKLTVGSATWKRFSGTRSTPLVAGGMVVTTTPDSNIYGIDLAKREIRWQRNAWKDFGSGKGNMGWGLPESPMLHDDMVIFNVCTRDDQTPPLVAVDVQTGKTVWSVDPGQGKKYSAADVSGACFRHGGRDLVAYPTWRYLLCVEARTGKRLWEIPDTSEKSLTPVYSDGLLLWGPSVGAQMLELAPDCRAYRVLWTRRSGAAGFSHAVILDGRVYMCASPYMAPGDEPLESSLKDEGMVLSSAISESQVPDAVKAQGPRQIEQWKRDAARTCQFVCLEARTGRLIHSIPCGSPGHIIAADGMVYFSDRVGSGLPRLTLIKPTPDGFEVAGQFTPSLSEEELKWQSARTARDAQRLQWAREDFTFQINVNPVIAEGRLFIRYGPLLVYDLRATTAAVAQASSLHGVAQASSLPAEAGRDACATPPPAAQGPQAADPEVAAVLNRCSARLEADRQAAVADFEKLDPAKQKAAVPALVALLRAGGEGAWPAQFCAAQILQKLGAAAAEGVDQLKPALSEALARRDGTLGELILSTLQKISPEAGPELAASVRSLLSHPDQHVRYLAIRALRQAGKTPIAAIPEMVELLRSDHKRMVRAAGEALAELGPQAAAGVPKLRDIWFDAIKKKWSAWSDLALETLDKIEADSAKPATSRVAALLKDDDIGVRRLAARALSRCSALAPEVTPALVEALSSGDQNVAEAAGAALRKMGPDAAAAVSALTDLLAGDNGPLAALAAGVLGALGPAAKPAVPGLTKWLAGQDVAMARACAAALKGIGPAAAEAVPALLTALKSRDTELVRSAVAALGAVGPVAQDAAPALRLLLGHGDEAVRWNSVEALRALGHSPVPTLIEALSSRQRGFPAGAVDVLGKLGPDASDAVPALTKALSAPDKRFVASVVNALGRIGRDAASAVPALVAASKAADAALSKAIQEALKAIKTANEPPQAQDVTVECMEGRTAVVTLPVADADDTLGALRAEVDKPPERGTLERRGPTEFLYSSTAGFTGKDRFSWHGEDPAAKSAVARGTVVITPDAEPPRIEKVAAEGDPCKVVIRFDEPVAVETLRKRGQCRIDPEVAVTQADVDESGRTVALTTGALAEKTVYTLSLRNIKDRARAGNALTANVEFQYWPAAPGLRFAYYEPRPPGDELAHFAEAQPKKQGVVAQPGQSMKERDTEFAVRFDGLLRVAAEGEYTFFTSSDAGSRLYIAERIIVTNDHVKRMQEASGKTKLGPGLHPLCITYHQRSGEASLKMSWSGPGFEKQEIPAAALFHILKPD